MEPDPSLLRAGLNKGRKYLKIKDSFEDGDEVLIKFDMALKILHQDPRIRSCRGMAALSRGPVVYCLEDRDNPGITLPPVINSGSLLVVEATAILRVSLSIGKNSEGIPVRFIPYFLWGNRGKSKMSVFFYPM